MVSDAVFNVTREILVESLGIAPEEVKLTSYLVDELGAESIDFLDIFHLAELKLGIRISEADLAPQLAQPLGDDDEWVPDLNRELEAHELAKLRELLPASTHERIAKGLHVYEIVRLLNVEVLASCFESKLQALAADPPAATPKPKPEVAIGIGGR